MSFTIQQLVDKARIPLNDDDKDRYSDAKLLTYAQDAYLMILRHRPDVLVGSFSAPTAWSALALGSTFPYVDDVYFPIIADYITGRAEMVDDEHVLSGRATAFITMFGGGLSAP